LTEPIEANQPNITGSTRRDVKWIWLTTSALSASLAAFIFLLGVEYYLELGPVYDLFKTLWIAVGTSALVVMLITAARMAFAKYRRQNSI
jgi:hypothetical protein